MDNSALEDDERMASLSQNGEISDIQFEEVEDIDEFQKKLQENINNEILGIETPVSINLEDEVGQIMATVSKARVLKDKFAKKYVVYIESDNIDFMESLLVDERKELVNKILREQSVFAKKKQKLAHQRQFLINVILACMTFIIVFPLLFILVNKVTESTILNYEEARQNFSKLYKEQGKIKSIKKN